MGVHRVQFVHSSEPWIKESLDTLDIALDFAEYLSMFENYDYGNDDYGNDEIAFENPFSNDFLQ